MRSSVAFVLALFAVVDARAGGLTRPRAAEPAMDQNGDIATLPSKHPEGTWLPLDLVGLRMRTTIEVNGASVPIILDTGASLTVLNETAAHAAGLDGPLVVRRPSKAKDATGAVIEGYFAEIAAVVIGPVRVKQVYAFVAPTKNENIGLLGYDVLAHVDLLFAFDEGLVGVFAPGTGPALPRSKTLRIATVETPKIPVPFDESGRATAAFVLDTGAPVTMMEDVSGDAFGLVVDPRFQGHFVGVGEKRAVTTGAYRIPALRLGKERIDVGPVTALRGDMSLLGNDVTLRHRALLSSDRATLSLSAMPIRPSTRSKGPDGKACAGGPCVKVGVAVRGEQSCLAIDIDRAWAGRVVEGVVDVIGDNGDSALGGGFVGFEAKVPDAGVHVCVDPAGAFAFWKVAPSTSTSLLRFRVRDRPQCQHELCVLVTGPTPTKG